MPHLIVRFSLFHCSLWFKCSENDGKMCVCAVRERVRMRAWMLRNEQLFERFPSTHSTSAINEQVVAKNLGENRSQIRSTTKSNQQISLAIVFIGIHLLDFFPVNGFVASYFFGHTSIAS